VSSIFISSRIVVPRPQSKLQRSKRQPNWRDK
jgi:hypothetical protein